jgi:hypothetical protein
MKETVQYAVVYGGQKSAPLVYSKSGQYGLYTDKQPEQFGEAKLFDTVRDVTNALRNGFPAYPVSDMRIARVRIAQTAPTRKVVPIEGASKFAIRHCDFGLLDNTFGDYAEPSADNLALYPSQGAAIQAIKNSKDIVASYCELVGIEEVPGEEVRTVEEL